jgi:hypothetical protein
MYCSGEIVDNTIHDATDGGIVVFSPNVIVDSNQIIASGSTHQFGGINLVDCQSGDNRQNTVVTNNYIQASAPARIDIGIAVGPTVWWCHHCDGITEYDFSQGTISSNTFSGNFGFAMAVSGVSDLTTSGNDWSGTVANGTPYVCGSQLPAPPPGFPAVLSHEDSVGGTNFFGEGGLWETSFFRERFFHLIQ